ncbi:oligosaccharyl transferase [Cordyceps fumosorosea ARSEF 2679]|uniref:Oligosaccharyl transferase n=1 Tax=Cordyceps fumosorosea (strain ARSEF 2679) TaxID=1081104 RepID=A0A167LFL5_CORFA|nr:oligosaccharyl transferase [Cordyceps fumosorosea ARSEF 2679]OAA53027.1 oligosaccharyl transferase [Cordyceps fumosorosea ARSEF 2679]
MRILPSLLGACLFTGFSSAEKKSSEQRFNELHKLSKSSPSLQLKETSYKSLTSSPRDYSAAVLLTALDPRFGCQLCREFQPEWDLLARSWLKGDKAGEARLLFGSLDFEKGKDVFASLGLQTAPVVMLFPPTEGPHAASSPEPIRYDFTTGGVGAESIHAWISRHMAGRPTPPVQRPFNYMRWATGATILLGVGTALATASPFILPIIQNRNIWASISLVSVLLFTSGHMFNHIRKVPYIAGDGKGGISYFAGGFQNQFGLETQIVAAIYGLLSFCTITLAVKVPRMTDAKTQQATVFIWGAVLFLMYSFLLSVFRFKNAGYPFSLPPFM